MYLLVMHGQLRPRTRLGAAASLLSLPPVTDPTIARQTVLHLAAATSRVRAVSHFRSGDTQQSDVDLLVREDRLTRTAHDAPAEPALVLQRLERP